MPSAFGASFDLGLGSLLDQQRDDMTDEEKRKKRMNIGLQAGQDLLGFAKPQGQSMAASMLGFGGGVRGR